MQDQAHHHEHDDHNSEISTTRVDESSENHHESEDCGCDCECPVHRIHSCHSLTEIAKNENVLILDAASTNYAEASISLKQPPILEGPFQPPRA